VLAAFHSRITLQDHVELPRNLRSLKVATFQVIPSRLVMISSQRSPPSGKRITHKLKFTKDEDLTLAQLVSQYGEADWPTISSRMAGRSVRQCRERWFNYLSPCVCNGPWTPDDDARLIEKVNELGPKWTKIVPFFKGRTDINIKNHWMTLSRRLHCSSAPVFAHASMEPLSTREIFIQSPTGIDHEQLLHPDQPSFLWEPRIGDRSGDIGHRDPIGFETVWKHE
jgi:hypothetical protein